KPVSMLSMMAWAWSRSSTTSVETSSPRERRLDAAAVARSSASVRELDGTDRPPEMAMMLRIDSDLLQFVVVLGAGAGPLVDLRLGGLLDLRSAGSLDERGVGGSVGDMGGLQRCEFLA